MTGWETAAVATGPAVVAGAVALVGSRWTTATARRAIEIDLEKLRVQHVYDRLSDAYSALVEAEREWERQPALFRDPEEVRRWNDKTFRPAMSLVYVLGTEEIASLAEALVDSHNAQAAGMGVDDMERAANRKRMIELMRRDLDRLVGR
jgi:hypothetical protein